jgi:hypothetical protein
MTDPDQIANAETQVFSLEDHIANAVTQVLSLEDHIANAETEVLSPDAQVFRSATRRGDASQPRPTRVAQASPRWIAWAYWALLALLAAGLAAGALIRVGSQPLIVALTSGLFSGAADG